MARARSSAVRCSAPVWDRGYVGKRIDPAKVEEKFAQAGCEELRSMFQPIFFAISNGAAAVRSLIETSPDVVSAKDTLGNTPLHIMLYRINEMLGRAEGSGVGLLRSSVNLSRSGSSGGGHLSARRVSQHGGGWGVGSGGLMEATKVVVLLIENNADPDAKNRLGLTPAQLAAPQILGKMRAHGQISKILKGTGLPSPNLVQKFEDPEAVLELLSPMFTQPRSSTSSQRGRSKSAMAATLSSSSLGGGTRATELRRKA